MNEKMKKRMQVNFAMDEKEIKKMKSFVKKTPEYESISQFIRNCIRNAINERK